MGVQRRAKRKSFKILLMGLLFLFVVAYLSYRAGIEQLVEARDARNAHRISRGRFEGFAPRSLGPEEAKTALLLVHGFLASPNAFAAFPEEWAAAGYFVRAMLLPGHGTSPLELAETPSTVLLEAVREEVQLLKQDHDQVVLIGHSMGGAICTIIAAQEQVDGLVLAAPYYRAEYRWYYGFPPETWVQFLAPLIPWVFKPRRTVQVFRPEAKKGIFSYNWVPSQAAVTTLSLGAAAQEKALLRKIQCPLLWIHSQRDRAASIVAAQKAVSAMPSSNKHVTWLPHSNHHIFWDYDQELVRNAINTFLADIP